jgi:hypothetical protein
MLETVDVGERSLAAYRGVAPEAILDELGRCAQDLRGARILHINATPYGGGVSELLRSVVPLLNDLGLIADWKIISGDDAFFQVTKTMHNGLQGGARGLSAAQQATYLANAEHNARLLEENYDFIFIHDPQPAAVLPLHGKGISRWVWRCHIDTAQPNLEIWNFLRGYLSEYDAAVFTMAEFAPPDLPITRVEIIPPAIDPLSPKNLLLAESATDPLIHIFTNLTGVGNIEVNAFQRLSDVVVQKSIREGFGLVVKERTYEHSLERSSLWDDRATRRRPDDIVQRSVRLVLLGILPEPVSGLPGAL